MIQFRGTSPRPWNWNIPRAFPLAYIKDVSHVEPVVIPAGKAVTAGAYLTLPIFSMIFVTSAESHPKGPSCRQSSGKPIAAMAAMLPTQGPFSHPIPVAKAALLVFESFASAVLAFAYAAAQSPSPAAANIGVANARRERIWALILAQEKGCGKEDLLLSIEKRDEKR